MNDTTELDHLEAEAEEHRQRIVESIETITDRLAPANLVREATEGGRQALIDVRDDGLRAIEQAGGQIRALIADLEDALRDNPVVAALAAAAIGIALTAALRPARRAADRDEYSAYGAGDAYVDGVSAGRRGSIRARAAGKLAGVRDGVARVADEAGDRLASIGERASRFGTTAADRIADGYEDARDEARRLRSTAAERIAAGYDVARDRAAGVGRTVEANPEAAIAVAVVAGALLAFAASPSRPRHH